MVVSRAGGVPPGPAIKEVMTTPRASPLTAARVPALPTLAGSGRFFAVERAGAATAPAPTAAPGRRTRSYFRSRTDTPLAGVPEPAARRVRFALPASAAPELAERPAREAEARARVSLPSAGGRVGALDGPPAGSSAAYCAAVSSARVHDTLRYRKGTLPHAAPSGLGSAAGVEAGPGAASAAAAALLKAAKEGDEDAVVDLLQHRAGRAAALDVNCADSCGRTAVSYAAAHGSGPMLDALLAIPGLDVNKADTEGNTPLHFAAQAGFAEAVDALAAAGGAHVDARNELGFTPLMKAALQGRTRCARALLHAGACPALRDPARGLRAEQWARFCGRHVCAEAIDKFARRRLLDRSAPSGQRWGSEPELGARLLLHHTNSAPAAAAAGGGLRSRLRRAFRPERPDPASYSLVSKLTTAALCVSTPALPAPAVPTAVRSLVRPLSVPRLQVTLAGSAAAGPEAEGRAPPLPDRPPTARPAPAAGRQKKKAGAK